MNTLMHILEAVGVGGAAGLSPLVAIAAVVIFAAVHMGINPQKGDFGFVAGVAMVAIAGLILAQSFLMIVTPSGVKVRIAADRPRVIALQLPLAVAIGALAGAMVYNANGHSVVVGAILGAMPAALVSLAATGLLGGVNRRLAARHAKETAKARPDDGAAAEPDTSEGRVLAAVVDVVTIVAVAVALSAPPVALVLPVLAVLLLVGGKRRDAKKHEGLRVLR